MPTIPAALLQGPPVLPIDVTGIILGIMGISIVLIPVIGFTARYALKPFVEALGQYLNQKDTAETVKILERRVALLEHQLEALEHEVEEIDEVSRFHRELEAGSPDRPGGAGDAAGSGGPGPAAGG